ncbi:MAG: dockerin type I repeat-containing protein, partial [candidate division Zixibacteria bacterium]|nr:dockerin type I repeat-containing protein [candidate division Zixibacteria bacterium]
SNYVFKNIAPVYIWGDANGDGGVDITDIVYLINYLFTSGPPPIPRPSGDPNNDCLINVTDIVYLINYLFNEGPAPLQGCA